MRLLKFLRSQVLNFRKLKAIEAALDEAIRGCEDERDKTLRGGQVVEGKATQRVKFANAISDAINLAANSPLAHDNLETIVQIVGKFEKLKGVGLDARLFPQISTAIAVLITRVSQKTFENNLRPGHHNKPGSEHTYQQRKETMTARGGIAAKLTKALGADKFTDLGRAHMEDSNIQWVAKLVSISPPPVLTRLPPSAPAAPCCPHCRA